jgi:hypothetical protein
MTDGTSLGRSSYCYIEKAVTMRIRFTCSHCGCQPEPGSDDGNDDVAQQTIIRKRRRRQRVVGMIAIPMIMFMISLKAASMTYITAFLQCTDKCPWLAGINGSWVQDFDFARDHGQYPSPWVIGPGPYFRRTAGAFVPSEDEPFPRRTSWKWIDNQKECQVDSLTYKKLCQVLGKLQDRRILLGDPLTQSM